MVLAGGNKMNIEARCCWKLFLDNIKEMLDLELYSACEIACLYNSYTGISLLEK